ncbi:hypothetical protein [Streptomyces telluris]|uniref:Uncharacterized protein n=1 Tax=Streptomyces telluris TaxID=2720021 RepID=A0A9X2LKS8_9ACTN|nr:hypothetical protein [Streptomyces telluris]MCQ8771575.1 hypothetical protein [Streptomyces telluris]NJP79424.1 hypothetical protein [Streptomyces telluris]
MKVELSIGRLVLEGVPGHRAAVLSRALEAELGALLAAAPPGGKGALVDLTDVHLRRVATAPVRATADPVALGRRVARAVHGALGMSGAAPATPAARREAAR